MLRKRVEMLEKFTWWEWDVKDTFDEMVGKVTKFAETCGRLPTQGGKAEKDEKNMGSWVTRQRQKMKKGQLSKARVEMLEKIPHWEWETHRTEEFSEGLELFTRFVERHGQLPKHNAMSEGEKACYKFKKKQCEYKKKGKLSPGKVKQLDSIPWWNWKKEDSFPARLEELRVFVEYGELPTRAGKREGSREVKLAVWLQNKLQAAKNGKLSDERVAQLETILGRKLRNSSSTPAGGLGGSRDDSMEETDSQLEDNLQATKRR